MAEYSDSELLVLWHSERSEAAFRAIVERYSGLVFVAAKRILADEESAKEAVQGTFHTLSRKASSLLARESLSGWLYLAAIKHAKNLRQVQKREMIKRANLEAHLATSAQEQERLSSDLQPILHEALSELSENERSIIFLRHYRSLSVAELAQELSIGIDAAQKRLDRAMKRLRGRFAKRGYAVGPALTVLLAAGLTKNATASTGLESEIVAAALKAAPSSVSSSLTIIITSLMAKKSGLIIAAVLVVALTTYKLLPVPSGSTMTGTAQTPASDGQSSGTEPRQTGKINTVRPAGATNGNLKQAAAASYRERLEKDFGQNKSRLSHKLVDQAIEGATQIQTMQKKMFSVLESMPASAMPREFIPGLTVSDEQKKVVVTSMLAYLKRNMALKQKSLTRLRENPSALAELLLLGDSCAQGRATEEEYHEYQQSLGDDARNLDIMSDPHGFSISFDGSVTDAEDPIWGELKEAIDAEQVKVLFERIQESEAKARKPLTFSSLPPTELANLEKLLRGGQAVLDGVIDKIENANPDQSD